MAKEERPSHLQIAGGKDYETGSSRQEPLMPRAKEDPVVATAYEASLRQLLLEMQDILPVDFQAMAVPEEEREAAILVSGWPIEELFLYLLEASRTNFQEQQASFMQAAIKEARKRVDKQP